MYLEENTPSPKNSKLEQLLDLNVHLSRSQKNEIVKALQATSLRLPNDGTYLLELSGKTLHVYETTQGITRYDFEDQSEPKVYAMGKQALEISVKGGGLNKIVLHMEAKTPTAQSISLQEISAPVELLEEYALLQAKKNPTIADLERKRELIKQIGKEFRDKADPDADRSRRGRYSSSSYSGEGRSWSSRSSG